MTTHRQLRAEGARQERGATIAFGAAHLDSVRRRIEDGRLSAEQGSLLIERMTAFFDAVGQGLHTSDGEF